MTATTEVGAATPPCWVCGRPLDTFCYRVRAWSKRTRPAWSGFARVCPDCYDRPRQNDDRHEYSDGRELLGVASKPCGQCGLLVVRKRDKRQDRHTCSEACRVALHRRQRRVREERNLEWTWSCYECKAVMTCQRSDQRYCSSACRQRAYRRRVKPLVP